MKYVIDKNIAMPYHDGISGSLIVSNKALPFTKMHGLGNDFMVIDHRFYSAPLSAEQVSAWADRNLGVGFDQLLLLAPSEDPEVDLDFLIYNANGQEVAQCGNGARCAALYALDRGLVDKSTVVLKTHTTRMHAQVMPDRSVMVRMAPPCFEAASLPFSAQWPQSEQGLYLPDGEAMGFAFDIVHVGNPHVVIQVPDVYSAPVDKVGAFLEAHAQFPEGTNVNFAEIRDSANINLRTFERGVGETRACGSGACATVSALQRRRLLADTVTVQMSVGALQIKWSGDAKDSIYMQGSGTYVFEGEIPLAHPC